jgi:hypothetical protein
LVFSIKPGRPEIFLAGRGEGDGVDEVVLFRLSVLLAGAAPAVEEVVESSLRPDSRGLRARDSKIHFLFNFFYLGLKQSM